jgi:hypothetical protein
MIRDHCCTHCTNCGRSFCRDEISSPCEPNGFCPDCCNCDEETDE